MLFDKPKPIKVNNYITSITASKYEVIEIIAKGNRPFIFMLANKINGDYPLIRIEFKYLNHYTGTGEDMECGINPSKCEITLLSQAYELGVDAKHLLKLRAEEIRRAVRQCLCTYAKSVMTQMQKP